MRFFAIMGIILALFLSIVYLMNTYKSGNPQWIFLVMAAGMIVLLSQNIFQKRR